MSTPSTSRSPVAVIPVAITTAIEVTCAGRVADVEVGGVQIDVGELDVVQPAGAERADDLIEPGADP